MLLDRSQVSYRIKCCHIKIERRSHVNNLTSSHHVRRCAGRRHYSMVMLAGAGCLRRLCPYLPLNRDYVIPAHSHRVTGMRCHQELDSERNHARPIPGMSASSYFPGCSANTAQILYSGSFETGSSASIVIVFTILSGSCICTNRTPGRIPSVRLTR